MRARPCVEAAAATRVRAMTELLAEWKDFNVAMVGATAALGGLVIVAGSVNIAAIVKSRSLTARLGSGIVLLLLALVVSATGLMPDVDEAWFGVLVLLLSFAVLAVQLGVTRAIVEDPDPNVRSRGWKAAIGYIPLTCYLVAGVLSIAGVPAALYLMAAGAILAIAASLAFSWVALVEILR